MPHSLLLIFGDTVDAALAFDRDLEPDVPRIVLVDNPVIAFALMAEISLVENVAISSAPKAESCVELSAAICVLVSASAWLGVRAPICRVESPLTPDGLSAAIWSDDSAAIISTDRPATAVELIEAISRVEKAATSSGRSVASCCDESAAICVEVIAST